MKLFLRLCGSLFTIGTIVFVVGAAVAAGFLWHYSKDLPDSSQLQNYEPPVMTRVHAADGSLIGEYARERRLYIPIQAVPKRVINAFLAAEDKKFYEHGGLDYVRVVGAIWANIKNIGSGRNPQGASTITQQVAKNFFLTNERSITRKIKEALLALRIERTYSKDKILELYLNQIFFGLGAHGIASASLVYFDKAVNEITIPEAAYLASLPKGPNNYNPFRQREQALERRNWVIDRMAELGFITTAEAEKAKQAPLGVTTKEATANVFAAEYFSEEVRRELLERYGEKKLYEGGLSVRTTLDTKLQALARKTLQEGLIRYDEAHGWHGTVTQIDISGDWGTKLADVKYLQDVAPWRLAVVLEVNDQSARIGLQPGHDPGGTISKKRDVGILPLEGVKWVRTNGKAVTKVTQVLNPGDVVYVSPANTGGQFRLQQIPEVSGAMVVEDPQTGRILAIVGGFSYDQSQFNRASQALRQPGSSFKPIVYATALDNGYTPSSIVLDAPIEVNQGVGERAWRPENFEGSFYGPSTLRFGIERSRNVMTVRLAQDIGMPLIADYAKRFGVYDDLPPYLSFSLGAGETTLLRMVNAYGMIDNGGRRIKPTLIDRIQDRFGKTVYKHDERECIGCSSERWEDQPEPSLIDRREHVLDPMTAYQITSIMEGVIQRGTATILRQVGKPIAGKTGTTNDEKDAWFVGFTPDIVVGVYVGFDKPKPLGRGMTGGHVAAPIVKDFLKVALADKPAVPFRVPPGIKLVRVDLKTGTRALPDTERVILEAFKPGTAPPDSSQLIGYGNGDNDGNGGFGGLTGEQPLWGAGRAPGTDRAVRSGTGGLY